MALADVVQVNEKVLTFMKYAQQELITMPTLRHTLEIENYMDYLLQSMVLNLKAKVLAEELITDKKKFYFTFTHTIEVPDGWWQQFKQDKFPSWILRRHPVRTKYIDREFKAKRTVDFTKYATYPMATIIYPDLGKPIHKYSISQ